MAIVPFIGSTGTIDMGYNLLPVYQTGPHTCVLLDTGFNFDYHKLTAALNASGLTPTGAIVTHMHIDHHGGSAWLKRDYGTQIAMPVGEAAVLANPITLYRQMDYFARTPEEQREVDTTLRQLPDVVIQPDCTQLDFCGATFAIQHIPGHSRDLIAVTTPDDVCYVSDAFICGGLLEKARLPYCEHWALDYESKRQLMQQTHTGWIVAHKGTITGDVRPIIQQNLDMMNQRMDDFEALLAQPMTREQFDTAVRKMLGMHSLAPDRMMHHSRHTRPYLEQLVLTGRVKMLGVDNALLYQKA